MNWKEQLTKECAMQDGLFGHIDFKEKDAIKFIRKLEKLNCSDFEIDCGDTIKFTMPPIILNMDRENVLFYILQMNPKPNYVHYNKKKDILECAWDGDW